MTLKYYMLLLCVLTGITAHTQVTTNFNNNTPVTEKGWYNQAYKQAVDFEVPAKDLKALLDAELAEQAKSPDIKPFTFAVPVPVNIDIAKSINWVNDEEYAFGRYTINMKGALSASINFDQFFLPKGAEIYVYNENGNMFTGPVTDKENNADKLWGSWVYKGGLITIEVKTPVGTVKELLLHANNLAYGYKQIYKTKVNDFGASGACNINVLCPLGTGWEPERNSVALVLNDVGSSWCSGAMLMNTCSNTTPFFLTANHCFNPPGMPQQNVGLWRFTFQAWSATCTPSQNSNGVTFNGSTLRANWATSDFCLLVLNTTPAAGSGIRYAGWNRSNTAATNETGIHHPSGDVMKISFDADPVVRTAYGGGAGTDHWQVNWNQGVTEGGSSGSPLFDQNHRVIGQLHGGPSGCGSSDLRDYYGSFDVSWTGGGTNATRLSNWLDGSNSGAVNTTTTNVSALAAPNTQTLTTITGSSTYCGSTTYGTNLSPGTNVTWSVTQPGTTLSCTFCPQTTLTSNTSGNEWITATYGCPVQTVTKPITNVNYTTFSTSGIHVWCRNQTSSVSVNTTTYPGLSNFVWGTPPTNWTKITGGTGSSYIVLRSGSTTSPPTGSQTVSATNSCGNTATGSHFMAISTMPGCGTMRVTPNPAKDVITIQVYDDNTGEPMSLSFVQTVELVNRAGIVTYHRQFNIKDYANNIVIPVSELKNDIYTLRIFDGGSWRSQKIIVQH